MVGRKTDGVGYLWWVGMEVGSGEWGVGSAERVGLKLGDGMVSATREGGLDDKVKEEAWRLLEGW